MSVATRPRSGVGAATTPGRDERPPAFPVPWGTVVPLALVLALADTFWVIALRGAVGAVERTQQPFASWALDSLLALPLTTLAVLLAVVSARGLLRTGLRWRFLTTWSLIAALATAAGVTHLVVSASYDFVLESRNNTMMSTSSGMCTTPDCLVRMQHATLGLQLRALAYGAVLLLVTNLVLTLVIATVRGRIDLAGRPSRPSRLRIPRHLSLPAAQPGDGDGLAPDVRLLLAAALAGAAVIHVAVAPEHLAEWPAAGVFFLVLALTELIVAGLLLGRSAGITWSTRLALTVLVSAVPLVVWAWSRAVGLPFGPSGGEREPVGASDVVTSLLELGTLVVAAACLRAGSRLRLLPARSATSRAVALLALAALTSLGLQTLGLGFGPM